MTVHMDNESLRMKEFADSMNFDGLTEAERNSIWDDYFYESEMEDEA